MNCCKLVNPLLVLALVLTCAASAQAQDTQRKLDIYGYFATSWEKTFNEPSLQNGQIVKEKAPAAWDYPSLNLMMQGQVSSKFRAFLNFNGA